MDEMQFRKITSRILRHSGLKTKINRDTGQYNMYHDSSPNPVLYCKPIIEKEGDENDFYLCFSIPHEFTPEIEKLYNRMIKRFTRLAPSVMIDLEKLFEPVFSDSELERIEDLYNEYNKGDSHETNKDSQPNSSL